MALKSMTGFGEGVASANGIRVVAEISSVNRKQLDINISLPRNLIILDAQIQNMVRRDFSRGRISGNVRIETSDDFAGSVRIDVELAARYVEGLRKMAAGLNLADDLSAGAIADLPGVVDIEQDLLDAERVSVILDEAMVKALEGLAGMRMAEGKTLEKDLRKRLGLLEEMVKEIRKMSPGVVADYRRKLSRRLKEAGFDDPASDERVVKEIALFADRCDLSEELTRLKSHLGQARKLLRATEPVGRTLDFLCQELFREINTVGSKANEVSITRKVVDFKTELERIREQVQNIE